MSDEPIHGATVIRCCKCRAIEGLEPSDLPGSGWRCADHDACRQRVRSIVLAHQGLAEILG